MHENVNNDNFSTFQLFNLSTFQLIDKSLVVSLGVGEFRVGEWRSWEWVGGGVKSG